MHKTRPAKITSPIVSLKDDYAYVLPTALIVGAIGIGASFFLSFGDFQLFSHVYLVNFCFLLSIAVGALFFVTIMHLTRAGWSVMVRRLGEILAMCTFPMLILFLPILIPVLMGMDVVYPWNAPGWSVVHADEALIAEIKALPMSERPPLEVMKSGYLNRGFFGIRIIAYFAIWGAMAWFFLSNSSKQDVTGDKSITAKLQGWSAPLMILFAATLVFASFDIEMTLEPLWFSTMFPVYFFAGAMGSALATITLAALLIQRSGRCTDEITTDHYHDMGKLIFAFVIFWGYIGFSQFMLIWYANIPEETFWFDWRINKEWTYWSIMLMVGHLFIPFLGLMARTLRRSRAYLLGASIYMLVMHWIDHYWLIMPSCYADHQFTFNPLVVFPSAIGMIAVGVGLFMLVARDMPLVPLKDPRIGAALNHEVSITG